MLVLLFYWFLNDIKIHFLFIRLNIVQFFTKLMSFNNQKFVEFVTYKGMRIIRTKINYFSYYEFNRLWFINLSFLFIKAYLTYITYTYKYTFYKFCLVNTTLITLLTISFQPALIFINSFYNFLINLTFEYTNFCMFNLTECIAVLSIPDDFDYDNLYQSTDKYNLQVEKFINSLPTDRFRHVPLIENDPKRFLYHDENGNAVYSHMHYVYVDWQKNNPFILNFLDFLFYFTFSTEDDVLYLHKFINWRLRGNFHEWHDPQANYIVYWSLVHFYSKESIITWFKSIWYPIFDSTNSQFINFLMHNNKWIWENPFKNEFVIDFSKWQLYYTDELPYDDYYPEPYIALASNQHHDLWFMYIVSYFFWLWFFFIYLILFFLLAFIWEVDYNRTHKNPQRETRGVSRSKCGDFITAIVPVSWATIILIHESTDAVDSYDGFGTIDFVIGVRAFQWGWEYYYPNSLKSQPYSYSKNSYNIGSGLLINNSSTDLNYFLNTKDLNLYKLKNQSILTTYLITNSDLNKEFFNINKMNNFGFSKLCIYNAYKFTLNSKSITYTKFFNTNLDLTGFNFKKFKNNFNKVYRLNNNLHQYSYVSTKNIFNNQKKYLFQHSLNLFFTKHLNYINNTFILKELLNKNTSSFVKIRPYSMTKLSTMNTIKTNDKLQLITNFIDIKGNYLQKNKMQNLKLNLPFFRSVNETLSSSFFNEIVDCLTFFKSSITRSYDNVSTLGFKYSNLVEIGYNWQSSQNSKTTNLYKLSNYSFLLYNTYAELDFKRLVNQELLEDIYWDWNTEFNSGSNYNNLNHELINDQFLFNYVGSYEFDKSIAYNHFLNFNNSQFWNNIHTQNNVIQKITLPYYILQIPNLNILFLKTINSFFNLKTFFLENNLNSFLTLLSFDFLHMTQPINLILTNIITYSSNVIETNNIYTQLLKHWNLSKTITNLKSELALNLNLKTTILVNNSLWKVYKSMIYDNKSFFNKENYYNITTTIPYVEKNLNISTLIKKNKLKLLESQLTCNTANKFLNLIGAKTENSLNLISFETPFTLSSESDSLKYAWTDWYSLYAKTQIKAQDLNQYNLSGEKLLVGKYEYKLMDTFNLNLLDNFYSKLLLNRKNYTNIFNFIPIILYKNLFNFNNYFYKINFNINEFDQSIEYFNYLLNFVLKLNHVLNTSQKSINQTFVNNRLLTNNKTYSFVKENRSAYFNYLPQLTNILLKRMYFLSILKNYNNDLLLYEIIKNWKSSITYNNKSSTIASPKIEPNLLNITFYYYKTVYESNLFWLTLFNNVWSILLYKLKIDYYYNWKSVVEISRPFFDNMISKIPKFTLNKPLDNIMYFNVGFINDIKDWIFSISTTYTNSTLSYYEVTQYKPMKKNIKNMLRIQPERPVCMPTDTRIQLMTWSKDIIHSWSIPSAGIKIDCIPGYSSHKSFNLTLSGLYFGQCMEICGRFHHWMPIVVYFVKSDVFFIWCNHFLINKNKNTTDTKYAKKITNNKSIVSN